MLHLVGCNEGIAAPPGNHPGYHSIYYSYALVEGYGICYLV